MCDNVSHILITMFCWVPDTFWTSVIKVNLSERTGNNDFAEKLKKTKSTRHPPYTQWSQVRYLALSSFCVYGNGRLFTRGPNMIIPVNKKSLDLYLTTSKTNLLMFGMELVPRAGTLVAQGCASSCLLLNRRCE